MPKIGSGGGGSRMYGHDGSDWQKLQVDANKYLKVVLQAAAAVLGKARLVTATGDEITDDTANAVKALLVTAAGGDAIGEVQASPTSYTILARLKDLLTGIVLAAGTANIGKVDPNTATPTVYNVTLTSANTEYSQAMPASCRGFEFQCRTEADVRSAFVTGKVATPTTPYLTLKAGDYYFSPPLAQGASPSTLYLASATAGVVVEIIAWT